MKYKVKYKPEAMSDIQEIINWYDEQKVGLGELFHNTIVNHIDMLKISPHIYNIRYKQIRCALVSKFPYMIHFYINEETQTVEILSVISTFRSPNIWPVKK